MGNDSSLASFSLEDKNKKYDQMRLSCGIEAVFETYYSLCCLG